MIRPDTRAIYIIESRAFRNKRKDLSEQILSDIKKGNLNNIDELVLGLPPNEYEAWALDIYSHFDYANMPGLLYRINKEYDDKSFDMLKNHIRLDNKTNLYYNTLKKLYGSKNEIMRYSSWKNTENNIHRFNEGTNLTIPNSYIDKPSWYSLGFVKPTEEIVDKAVNDLKDIAREIRK